MMTLTATKFERYVEGTTTFGFCLYDEYGQYYDNNMESKCEDDLELLGWAIEQHPRSQRNDDEIAKALYDIKGEESGITINGQTYDWDEIKHLF